jgi:Fe-S cluster assembly protein SufD
MANTAFLDAINALIASRKGGVTPDRLVWPAENDEEWRFTSLHGLSKISVSLPITHLLGADVPAKLSVLQDAHRIVFLNGRLQTALSDINGIGGLSIRPAGVTPLNREDTFTTISDLLAESALEIHLHKDANISKPLYLLHIVSDDSGKALVLPRTVVRAERFSHMVLVEDFVDLTEHAYVQIPVSNAALAEGAHLVHVKLQRQNRKSFFLNRSFADIGRDAHYESYTISLGALFSRNDVVATQQDTGIQCTLDGLVMLSGNQFSDTHSVMDHAKPHGESHQLHKVILLDRAHSVFNGKIFVRPGAQKTNSFQENRTLLLSELAKVNTKPQLEIFADDVKCSHGATVGQLVDEQMFYLKSRGLNEESARQLLIHAFAGEVIQKIPVPELSAWLDRYVTAFVPKPEEHLA